MVMIENKKTYSREDIVCDFVSYDRKEYFIDQNGQSQFRFVKDRALCFMTKDGKYTTGKPDSNDFSYWHQTSDNMMLGSTSCDYVFGCESGIDFAIRKLNSLIPRDC